VFTARSSQTLLFEDCLGRAGAITLHFSVHFHRATLFVKRLQPHVLARTQRHGGVCDREIQWVTRTRQRNSADLKAHNQITEEKHDMLSFVPSKLFITIFAGAKQQLLRQCSSLPHAAMPSQSIKELIAHLEYRNFHFTDLYFLNCLDDHVPIFPSLVSATSHTNSGEESLPKIITFTE